MITIYKITNRLKGRLYIGQTHQPIEKRFIQHSKTNSPLGNTMQESGLENFTIKIIAECETQDKANERERFWIKALNCKMPNGYNRSNGGEGGIYKPRNISLNKEVFVMAIGDNIKNLRVQYNLSQAELANVAGVSDKAVSSWEQNKSVPRMGPIQKMADFFGIKKSDIIEPFVVAIHTSKGRNIKNETSLTYDESKLLADYRNLNGNNRQAVNVMIALFLSQQTGGDDNFTPNVAAV